MIFQLTEAEKKTINLINQKLDFEDTNEVNKIYDFLVKSGRCKSEGGLKFLNAFSEFKETGLRQKNCIFCAGNLQRLEKIICSSCISKLENTPNNKIELVSDIPENEEKSESKVLSESVEDLENEKTIEELNINNFAELHPEDFYANAEELKEDYVAESYVAEGHIDESHIDEEDIHEENDFYNDDINDSVFGDNFENDFDDDEYTKTKSFNLFMNIKGIKKTNLIITIIEICLILSAVIFMLVVRFNNSNNDINALVDRFSDSIAENGMSLSNKPVEDENSLTYFVYPDNDQLSVFFTDNNPTGIALAMDGNDKESKERQVFLITKINQALFGLEDTGAALSITSSIMENKGVASYEGYECLLLFTESGVLYYVIDSSVMDENILDQLNSIGVKDGMNSTHPSSITQMEDYDNGYDSSMTVLDGITFLGRTREDTDKVFGDSSNIIDQYTVYYIDAGISVIIDEASETIIYIDADGSGVRGNVAIAGIYAGISLEEAKKELSQNNISLIEDNDGTYRANFVFNNKEIELNILESDGIVTLVDASIEPPVEGENVEETAEESADN